VFRLVKIPQGSTTRADKRIMVFELTAAWAVAATLAAALLWFGRRNRRSGWRRKRHDTITDVLMKWAATKAPQTPAPPAAPTMTSDLTALGTALGTPNPGAPAPTRDRSSLQRQGALPSALP
jgi:hypothetical protein